MMKVLAVVALCAAVVAAIDTQDTVTPLQDTPAVLGEAVGTSGDGGVETANNAEAEAESASEAANDAQAEAQQDVAKINQQAEANKQQQQQLQQAESTTEAQAANLAKES